MAVPTAGQPRLQRGSARGHGYLESKKAGLFAESRAVVEDGVNGARVSAGLYLSLRGCFLCFEKVGPVWGLLVWGDDTLGAPPIFVILSFIHLLILEV